VHMQRRRRVVAVAIGIVAFLVPFALEVSGVLGRSYGFVNGTMAILPRGVELPQTATLVVLGLSGVLGIATGAIAVSHVRDALAEAERSLYLYAWHLRELVPDTARRATADRTKPRPPRPPASTDDRATRPMAKYS
jgi:eukaryotic-like serine/threonine-protein kinase